MPALSNAVPAIGMSQVLDSNVIAKTSVMIHARAPPHHDVPTMQPLSPTVGHMVDYSARSYPNYHHPQHPQPLFPHHQQLPVSGQFSPVPYGNGRGYENWNHPPHSSSPGSPLPPPPPPYYSGCQECDYNNFMAERDYHLNSRHAYRQRDEDSEQDDGEGKPTSKNNDNDDDDDRNDNDNRKGNCNTKVNKKKTNSKKSKNKPESSSSSPRSPHSPCSPQSSAIQGKPKKKNLKEAKTKNNKNNKNKRKPPAKKGKNANNNNRKNNNNHKSDDSQDEETSGTSKNKEKPKNPVPKLKEQEQMKGNPSSAFYGNPPWSQSDDDYGLGNGLQDLFSGSNGGNSQQFAAPVNGNNDNHNWRNAQIESSPLSFLSAPVSHSSSSSSSSLPFFRPRSQYPLTHQQQQQMDEENDILSPLMTSPFSISSSSSSYGSQRPRFSSGRHTNTTSPIPTHSIGMLPGLSHPDLDDMNIDDFEFSYNNTNAFMSSSSLSSLTSSSSSIAPVSFELPPSSSSSSSFASSSSTSDLIHDVQNLKLTELQVADIAKAMLLTPPLPVCPRITQNSTSSSSSSPSPSSQQTKDITQIKTISSPLPILSPSVTIPIPVPVSSPRLPQLPPSTGSTSDVPDPSSLRPLHSKSSSSLPSISDEIKGEIKTVASDECKQRILYRDPMRVAWNKFSVTFHICFTFVCICGCIAHAELKACEVNLFFRSVCEQELPDNRIKLAAEMKRHQDRMSEKISQMMSMIAVN